MSHPYSRNLVSHLTCCSVCYFFKNKTLTVYQLLLSLKTFSFSIHLPEFLAYLALHKQIHPFMIMSLSSKINSHLGTSSCVTHHLHFPRLPEMMNLPSGHFTCWKIRFNTSNIHTQLLKTNIWQVRQAQRLLHFLSAPLLPQGPIYTRRSRPQLLYFCFAVFANAPLALIIPALTLLPWLASAAQPLSLVCSTQRCCIQITWEKM